MVFGFLFSEMTIVYQGRGGEFLKVPRGEKHTPKPCGMAYSMLRLRAIPKAFYTSFQIVPLKQPDISS